MQECILIFITHNVLLAVCFKSDKGTIREGVQQVTLHHAGKGVEFGERHLTGWRPVSVDKKCVWKEWEGRGTVVRQRLEKEDLSVGRQLIT